MNRLPAVSARRMIRALEKAGFHRTHQRGSHVHLFSPSAGRPITVPLHSGDLKRPLVKAILKQAGLSEDQFRELL